MNEAHLGTENSHIDLRTTQHHTAPVTKSDLLYKAAMLDRSHSVFQGLINVQPAALNANAYQMNRNLLLGEEASTNTIPKLEILVDEVRCSHGATAGFLDKNIIFYHFYMPSILINHQFLLLLISQV